MAWAQAVMAAVALPENHGKGVIRVEGRMAELLHLAQADEDGLGPADLARVADVVRGAGL